MNHAITFDFPLTLEHIDECIDQIDPVKYGKTRNYIDGDVTYLSPYISRWVVSVAYIARRILARGYQPHEIEIFLKELLWKEYFWRIGEARGCDAFLSPLRYDQEEVKSEYISVEMIEARTQIQALDAAIETLYATGYIHNHLRMYLSSLSSNIYRSSWLAWARWMYAHLLDHDIASNMASWQWGCGVFSSKRYLANQDNINQYTHTHQKGTFLDVSYEEIDLLHRDAEWYQACYVSPDLSIYPSIDTYIPQSTTTQVYTSYTLDPLWSVWVSSDRILLLSPSHFRDYSVSDAVLSWTVALARSIIPGIQVYVGEIKDIQDKYPWQSLRLQSHYTHRQLPSGISLDPRSHLVPQVSGYFPSFFAYYQRAKPYLFRLSYDPNTAPRLSAHSK